MYSNLKLNNGVRAVYYLETVNFLIVYNRNDNDDTIENLCFVQYESFMLPDYVYMNWVFRVSSLKIRIENSRFPRALEFRCEGFFFFNLRMKTTVL